MAVSQEHPVTLSYTNQQTQSDFELNKRIQFSCDYIPNFSFSEVLNSRFEAIKSIRTVKRNFQIENIAKFKSQKFTPL